MEPHKLTTAVTTLVLYLLILSPPTTAATDANVVVDIEGNLVVPGSYYYLLPSNNGGGGLSTVPMGSTTCPTNFMLSQLNNRANLGIPVAFFPQNDNDVNQHNTIKLSSNLKIYNKYYESPNPFMCPLVYSTFWALTGDAATGNIYVVLDGVAVGNRLSRPDPSWFQIENDSKTTMGYKIVFRPGVSVDANVVAGQVAVMKSGNGQGVLTLNDKDSLVVHFVKA
ncbi:hypothetical protein RND81_03G102800 [Saponaria officinalis]|uniref:Uncharacterized protein n=1 Tax=Saponaria officinalis TaxID=3572 RepID=A0AAW1M9H7_SAPOF